MYNRGYITGGLIISLFVVSLCVLLGFNFFKVVASYNFHDEGIQDQIGLIQLSRYISNYEEIRVFNNKLEVVLSGEVMTVSKVNDNLIIQPGTQFILVDIDEVYFYKSNGLIFIKYLRNEISEESIIGYE